MCYGYDGDAALERSLAAKGASRRSLLGGAVAGAAGISALGALTSSASAAPGAASGGRGGGKAVPHDKISIQLYTLRSAAAEPNGTDPARIGYQAVLEAVARYGYPRVELAGYYGQTASGLRSTLDGLDLWASSSHDGVSGDNGALHTKMQNAVTMGQKYVNVPYLNSGNRSDWERWADQMNEEASVAKSYGLKYGYHNHAHEFTIDLGGGTTPWDVFMDRLDPKLVHLEADLYWVFTGGINSGHDTLEAAHRFTTDVINDSPLRVRQYHVKDRTSMGTSPAEADMCDLGAGVIDFARLFRNHQVEEYIVENDTPDNPAAPLLSAAVGHLYLDHLRF